MNSTMRIWILPAAMIAATVPARFCGALDMARLGSEFSLPDRPRNLIDTQDEYFRAVELMQDDDAAVVRARESAMKDAQSAPDYVAAVKAVDQAYQAFMEKKNATISNLEKTNPNYSLMKSHIAQIDSQIETALQNPATTQDQLEQLYKDRETFLHQCRTAESDAIDRETGLPTLRQAWMDASKKLSDMQEKQRSDVENNDRLKAAIAAAAAAMTAVHHARTAISGASAPDATKTAHPSAADLLYRSSHANFAGNDAWLTYGWTDLSEATGNKPTPASPSAGDGKK